MTLPGWKELPPGAVVTDPGSTDQYPTGAWRTERPVVDMEKCTHCMICWIFCPEGTVLAAEGRFLGFDLEHCKGCGICAVECPRDAIEMVPEAQAREGEVTT